MEKPRSFKEKAKNNCLKFFKAIYDIPKNIRKSAFCKKYSRADMYNLIDNADENAREALIE